MILTGVASISISGIVGKSVVNYIYGTEHLKPDIQRTS